MRSEALSYTRRELLFGLAGSALAFSKPRNSMYNPQIAADSSIWLAEAERRSLALPEILDEAFAVTAHAGYRRLELPPALLDRALRDRVFGLMEKHALEPAILSAAGPLFSRDIAENTRNEVAQMARAAMGRGGRFLNFSPSAKPGGEPKTTEELDTEAYQLNRMGDELGSSGLGLMMQPGPADLRDGARQWRYVLAHTEAAMVSCCLDTDEMARAGLFPLAMIDTAGPRLRALRLRNSRNGVEQELLREGDVDMARIARLLRRMSYDGLLVVALSHGPELHRLYPLGTGLSLSRRYVQDVFGTRPGNPPVEMGPHVRKHSKT